MNSPRAKVRRAILEALPATVTLVEPRPISVIADKELVTAVDLVKRLEGVGWASEGDRYLYELRRPALVLL